MNEGEAFFLREVVRHGRELPLHDSSLFISGLVSLAGEHSKEVDSLRLLSVRLKECDQQLAQIASGEIKLPLNTGKSS
jgi:hypothetical protein